MANEIAKLQSERKVSSSPKNFDQHGMVDSNSHHNDAILDCISLKKYFLLNFNKKPTI